MIVELVKLGFLGFATAIIVFSFLLLQKIVETKEIDGENLVVRCREIRIFMLMSILVIFIGMAWEVIDPHVTVKFNVSPQDAKGLIVKVDGKIIDITKEGGTSIRDRYNVFLDLVAIDREMRNLALVNERFKESSEGAKNQLKSLKKQDAREELQAAAQENEAGI